MSFSPIIDLCLACPVQTSDYDFIQLSHPSQPETMQKRSPTTIFTSFSTTTRRSSSVLTRKKASNSPYQTFESVMAKYVGVDGICWATTIGLEWWPFLFGVMSAQQGLQQTVYWLHENQMVLSDGFNLPILDGRQRLAPVYNLHKNGEHLCTAGHLRRHLIIRRDRAYVKQAEAIKDSKIRDASSALVLRESRLVDTRWRLASYNVYHLE